MATFLMHCRHVARWGVLALGVAGMSVLCGCSGCASVRHGGTARAEERPPAGAQPADIQGIALLPVETELSSEALSTFAFLAFSQAMQQEDESALAACAPLLAQTRAPAGVWLEGGVWLMGRKSPHTLAVMQAALKVWPDNVSINLLCAEAFMEKGEPEAGAALMRRFLDRHPDSLDARLELALLLVKSGQFPDAEALLTGIRGKQRTPLVEYYHARALIGMGRAGEAAPYLQKAVRAMPDFVEALAELALLHERSGDLKAARADYERLLKLDFSPRDVLLRLVAISLRLNQPERALAYARQGPENVPFTLAVASMFIDARHYLQGERLLTLAAGQPDAPAEVFLMLADLAWEQRRDLERAFGWLDKIPPGARGAERGLLLRAQLLTQAGRDAEALAVVDRARAACAGDPELSEALVRMLARLDRKDAAMSECLRAVRQWPDNQDLLFLLGALQDECGDKRAALATMESLLARHPENHQALNYVGYTLAEENRDLERAVALLRKADSLAPNQAYIVDSLAWAYFKSGKLDDALREIRRATKLDTRGDAAIWEHYGDIAARMALKEEARRAYRKALDLKPDNADALRQRLSQL